MGPLELVILAAVMFFAAAVQGAVGFGFGLVAVALLSVFLEVDEAALLNAVPALAINLALLWRLRRCFSLRRLKPLILATVAGAPAGVLLLDRAGAGLLYGLLAATLFASVAHGAWPGGSTRRAHPLWLGLPMGGLAGVLAGVFGTGGPPLVAYVAAQRFQKFRYVAAVQAVLGVANASRLVIPIPLNSRASTIQLP